MKEDKIGDALRRLMENDLEAKKFKPYLDSAVKEVQKIDNKIKWFEDKIKEEETKKQIELKKVADLFELALVNSHQLTNGYKVMIDNKYNLEVHDVGAFLKWLKVKCEPQDVLEFFSTSIKKASLKTFCEKYINKGRIDGKFQSEIEIDGIKINDLTFRRLTTKEGKK